MKLIIEVDHAGRTYVYRETEKHHKVVEKTRSNLVERTIESCDHECLVSPGEYFVLELVK